MGYDFLTGFSVGASIPDFGEDVVKDEPMFFRATEQFCMERGGPITLAFLSALRRDGIAPEHVLIDTRVHMLMPGMWPCIPGWHHDDVPRTRGDGQPDYDGMTYRSQFALALVNGDVAPTNFALGVALVPTVPLGAKVYKQWDEAINEQIEDGSLLRVAAPSNRLIYFDWSDFHEGTQAVRRGWRWFGRATWNSGIAPRNEVRRQVQVYMENPKEGW